MNSIESVSPVGLDPVPDAPTYPTTRRGWLHQFCSLVSRAEVAREIGRDAMLLILAIAVQEDALKYGSAPILFDSELQRLTGIRSRQHLDRIRQKAVDAGWLVVVRNPDADQTVAQYWTLIPKRLNVFDRPANVVADPDKTEAQPSPEAGRNEVDAERAVANQAGVAQKCETSGETSGKASGAPGATADRCPPEVLKPCAKSPADAEPEAHLGTAGHGVGPSHPQAPELVTLSTPGTQESSGNKPAVPAVTGTAGDQRISVVAAAAASTQAVTTQVGANQSVATQAGATTPGPGQSFAVPVVVKKLSEYSALIRQQAGALLAAYPSRLDLEKGLLSICRALEKVPYAQLRPLVDRYGVARDRPGQDLKLTPSAATWFDQERWREGPQIWEIRDKDLVKKKP